MASNTNSYPLSRGFRASARLNLQHFLQVQDVGYLVHPDIPLVAENLKIADVGAGTGIWLMDLVNHIPSSVQLDGFDINISQCPPKEWLPSNISVNMLDIIGKLPDELLEVYDVINIRYFSCVVQNNNPSPVLENVLRMLKPGGYLQWSEQDYASQQIITANPETSSSPFTDLKGEFEAQSKLDIDAFNWISTLDRSFQEHGMVDVQVARRMERPQNRSYWQHTYMMVLEELSHSVPNGEAVRNLIQKTQEQTPEGVFWFRGHLTFVGRKI